MKYRPSDATKQWFSISYSIAVNYKSEAKKISISSIHKTEKIIEDPTTFISLPSEKRISDSESIIKLNEEANKLIAECEILLTPKRNSEKQYSELEASNKERPSISFPLPLIYEENKLESNSTSTNLSEIREKKKDQEDFSSQVEDNQEHDIGNNQKNYIDDNQEHYIENIVKSVEKNSTNKDAFLEEDIENKVSNSSECESYIVESYTTLRRSERLAKIKELKKIHEEESKKSHKRKQNSKKHVFKKKTKS